MATWTHDKVLIKATGFSNGATNPLGDSVYDIGYNSWTEFRTALTANILVQNTTVDIDGDVTSDGSTLVFGLSDYTLTIQPKPGTGHAGQPGTGSRILNTSATTDLAVIRLELYSTTSAGKIDVVGLQLYREGTTPSSSDCVISFATASGEPGWAPGHTPHGTVWVRRCLVYFDGDGMAKNGGTVAIVNSWSNLDELKFENCCIVGLPLGSGTAVLGPGSNKLKVHHCTVLRAGTDSADNSVWGFYQGEVKNSYFGYFGNYGTDGGDFRTSANTAGNNNASHDNSADGSAITTGAVTGVDPATNLTSIGATTWPWNLLPVSGSSLRNAGAAGVSAEDIRGYQRSTSDETNPTIGAFEFNAQPSGTSIAPLAAHHYAMLRNA